MQHGRQYRHHTGRERACQVFRALVAPVAQPLIVADPLPVLLGETDDDEQERGAQRGGDDGQGGQLGRITKELQHNCARIDAGSPATVGWVRHHECHNSAAAL